MYARYAAKCGHGEDFDKMLARFSPLPEDQNLDSDRFTRFLQKKEFPKAYSLAASLSDAHPDDSRFLNKLSWSLLVERGVENPNLVLADKIASRANAAANEKSPSILDTLARVRFLQGKKEEAILLEEKALSLAREEVKPTYEKALESFRKGELPTAE